MSRRPAVLISVVLLLAVATTESFAQSACDRACLSTMLDRYA